MNDNIETKYRSIIDIAKTMSNAEILILEKMLLDLWCDNLTASTNENN